jgi:hypothetical protein
MAKKHKKTSHKPVEAKPDNTFAATLGAALGDTLKKIAPSLPGASDTPKKDAAHTRAERSRRADELLATARAQQPAAPTIDEEQVLALDDAQLFERAVETIKPEAIYPGKYQGEVKGLPAAPTPAPVLSKKEKKLGPAAQLAREAADAEAREAIFEQRERLVFERMVGGVNQIDGADKYYVPPPPDPEALAEQAAALVRPYSTEQPEGLLTSVMPKSGDGLSCVKELDVAQVGLLKRFKLWSRGETIEPLNVRGDTVSDALRQLELFFHQQWRRDVRYVRVIHGRGLQSEDQQPVVKPAVLTWLEGPGLRYVRGYAPELTPSGDYGSVVVQLRPYDPREDQEPRPKRRRKGQEAALEPKAGGALDGD